MFSRLLKSNIVFAAFVAMSVLAYSREDASSADDTLRTYVTPAVTIIGTKAQEGVSPFPFSEINKKDIEKQYVTEDIPKLLSNLPSVMYSSQNGNAIGYSNIKMRGFDQRRISVMINGIPQNDPEDHEVYWVDLPDLASSVESIQVQRGAGLSDYGLPSIGGMINLTTNNFAGRNGFKFVSGIGFQEYSDGKSLRDNVYKNLFEYSSGLMKNNWAFYVKGSKISSDGYRERSWTTLQSYFVSLAHFSDKLSTQINFFGGPASDALAYNGIPKQYIKNKELRRKNYAWGGWAYKEDGTTVDYTIDRSKYETEEYTQPHFEILNDYRINKNLSFQSSLFFYTGKGYYDGDMTWADDIFNSIAASDFLINDASCFKGLYTRSYVENKQGGFIPRLIYKKGNNELQVGGEIRIHRSDHYLKTIFAEQLPSAYDMDYDLYSYNGKRNIFSFFVKDSYSINDVFTVFSDLQLTHHLFAIDNERLGSNYVTYSDQNGEVVGGKDKDIFSTNYTFVNPRLGLNAKLQKNLNTYLFVAYTFREPRMKNLYNASETYCGAIPNFSYSVDNEGTYRYDFSDSKAKPEKMLDIEIGSNLIFDDYKLSANAYIMDYHDEFVKTGKIDKFGTSLDENAARSRHIGIELSGNCKLFSSGVHEVSAWANITYNRNYFIDYDVYFGTSQDNQTKISLKDNSISGFPDLMSGFGFIYSFGNLYCGLSGKYVGKFYTDNYDEMLKNNQTLIDCLKAEGTYYADNVVDDYLVFDFDASYSFQNINKSIKSLTLRAKICNLTNRLYAFSGEGMEFFPAAERNYYFGFELGL